MSQKQTKLASLRPREASIFYAFSDTVIMPEGKLPSVNETQALEAFDHWLSMSPTLNRVAFRVLLYLIELGSVPAGFGKQMRRLSQAERRAYLNKLEETPFGGLVKTMGSAARFVYYADPQVMLMLGYNSDAVVDRGKKVRLEEGRW